MEQQFRFGYGEGSIPLTVRARHIEVLEAVTPPPITDLREAFRAAVEENAIGGRPLKSAVKAADPVTVIISDLTRAWMHQERICPLLVDYLHRQVGMVSASMPVSEAMALCLACSCCTPSAAAKGEISVRPE